MPKVLLALSLAILVAMPITLFVLRLVSTEDTIAFLEGAEKVLLAVLGVITVANKVLKEVKAALTLTKEIIIAAKEVIAALPQWLQWLQWAETPSRQWNIESLPSALLFLRNHQNLYINYSTILKVPLFTI